MPGTLFVVATPIGNLDDVTVRALRVLREVSVIAAEDTRRTAHLLAHYDISTSTTSLHEHNESLKTPRLIERLLAGENVALVSDAGTPLVSDPGGHLVEEAVATGIRVEPVPGPSAIFAALSAAGLPTQPFTFLGFPPTKPSLRAAWFKSLSTFNHTVIFFESARRIRATLGDVAKAIGGSSRVSLGRELTKLHEEFVRGPIIDVLNRVTSPIGEFTVVVYVGQTTNNDAASHAAATLSPQEIANEFGLMIENGSLTRKQALAALSRRYNIPRNQLYRVIEKSRK